MKILNKNSNFPKNVSLILGFFDGIHLGHRELISHAPKALEKVLVTFSKSPAEYFTEEFEYIYDGDNADILLNELDNAITKEEFEENFEKFTNRATDCYCNNDWVIQEMHDIMHETLIDVIKDYLADK